MSDKPLSASDADLAEQVQWLLHASSSQDSRQETVRLLQRLLTPAVCRRLGLYPIPADFLLSVIVPIYNEVQTVERLIERVREVPIPLEIILVDDGSTDGTRELVDKWAGTEAIQILRHAQNRGKGAAPRQCTGPRRSTLPCLEDPIGPAT